MPKQDAVNSSSIMESLYGDFSPYSRILREQARKISKKYPDKQLASIFEELPYRSISLIPVIMYAALMKDLKKKPDKDVISAIGLACLPIGTHDDVVDEMFRSRRTVSSLVYSGNIAGLEGMRILFEKKKPEAAKALIDSINSNHYRQHRVVKILWEGKEITPEDYFEGISHIIDFVSIGLLAALADAKRPDLKKRIMKFSRGYGFALQLIDDIREVEKDRENGYSSLPLAEGKPYSLSLSLAHENLKEARKSIPRNWRNLNGALDRAEIFLNKIEDDLNA